LNSIDYAQPKLKFSEISAKSQNLKINKKDIWKGPTSPIIHRIIEKFFDNVECDSEKFQRGGNKQSDVNDAVRRLVYEDILFHVKSKKGRSSKRKRDKKPSFVLTPKGIEIVIDRLVLCPERKNSEFFRDFWNSVSITFQKSKISDFEILEMIFVYYEENALKINRDYIVPTFFTDIIKNLKESGEKFFMNAYLSKEFSYQSRFREESFFEREILRILSDKKTYGVSKSILIEKLKIVNSSPENTEKYLKKFSDEGIINNLNHKKLKKYELTVLGLVKLFHQLHSEYSTAELLDDKKGIKNIINNFEIIRNKYSNLLEMVLKDKNYKNLKLNIFDFLQIFEYLYFGGIFRHLEISLLNGFSENVRLADLPKLDNIRANEFRRRFEKHLRSYTNTSRYFDQMFEIHNKKIPIKIKQSQVKNIRSRFPFDIVYLKNLIDKHWLNFINGFSEFSKPSLIPNIEKFNKNEFFPRPSQLDKSIERKITFDFYSVYLAPFGTQVDSSVEKSIKKWYYDQVMDLSNWLSNYSKELVN